MGTYISLVLNCVILISLLLMGGGLWANLHSPLLSPEDRKERKEALPRRYLVLYTLGTTTSLLSVVRDAQLTMATTTALSPLVNLLVLSLIGCFIYNVAVNTRLRKAEARRQEDVMINHHTLERQLEECIRIAVTERQDTH